MTIISSPARFGFLPPNPTSKVSNRHVQNAFPNVFYITQNGGCVSKFNFWESIDSRVRLTWNSLRFGSVSLCVKMSFREANSWTSGLSAVTKLGLSLSCTQKVNMLEKVRTKFLESSFFCFLKFGMIRTLLEPMLHNISNLISELYSLVTFSALYLSVFIFAQMFLSRLFDYERSKSFAKRDLQHTVGVSQNSILEKAAESRVRLTWKCLMFGSIFFYVKLSCKKTISCWAKDNWWTLRSDKKDCVCLAHKIWFRWKH